MIILAFHFSCLLAKAFYFTEPEIVSRPPVNKVTTEHGTVQAQFEFRLFSTVGLYLKKKPRKCIPEKSNANPDKVLF